MSSSTACSPPAAPVSVPPPPDTLGLCSPLTACTRSHDCPAGGFASQSSSCSARCSAACAAASAGKAWLVRGWHRVRGHEAEWSDGQKVAHSDKKRGGAALWVFVGGLYDLTSDLRTLARRQTHCRVERRTPARRWPIPRGVRRTRSRRRRMSWTCSRRQEMEGGEGGGVNNNIKCTTSSVSDYFISSSFACCF